jgi:hypothetical protein
LLHELGSDAEKVLDSLAGSGRVKHLHQHLSRCMLVEVEALKRFRLVALDVHADDLGLRRSDLFKESAERARRNVDRIVVRSAGSYVRSRPPPAMLVRR